MKMLVLIMFLVLLVLVSILSIFLLFPVRHQPKILFARMRWIAGCCVLVVATVTISQRLNRKIQLTKEDLIGSYVIDRHRYAGKQADWQYDHFWFEITADGQFIFNELQEGKIIRSSKVAYQFLSLPAYTTPRLALYNDSNRHHIISSDPALYRSTFSYRYVFHSPKFGNVFFKKGKWEPVKH